MHCKLRNRMEAMRVGQLSPLYGSSGSETIDGGGSLGQGSAPDVVFAGDDDDKVVGGLGADYIDGGLNNDSLWGHGGNGVIDGGDGDDHILGDGILEPGFYQTLAVTLHGNDVLDGGAGNDGLIGGGKDDGLFGGAGNDKLYGDDQSEAYLAGQYHGSDYLDGGADDDELHGGGKDDTLIGGDGADKLWGDIDVIHIAPLGIQRVLTDSLALFAAYAQVDSTASDAGNDGAWKEAA